MRTVARWSVAVGIALAGCAAVAPPAPPDPETCFALFEELDRAERLFPRDRFDVLDDTYVQNPRIGRVVARIRTARCTTDLTDLGAMDALLSELTPFGRLEGGGPAQSTALQVGIVTGLTTEVRAATFFGNLGYRYRSTGTEGLGRRIYIGPIRSQAEMDQALDIARRAGFIAPYPARYTRF